MNFLHPKNGLTLTVFFACFDLFRKVLPPQTGELNIHFGVFFGGLGDFSEPYVNAVDNFRGCMSDVRIQIALVTVRF